MKNQRILLVLLLFSVIGFGAYYSYNKELEKKAELERIEEEASKQRMEKLVERIDAAAQNNINEAIKKGLVIRGMTHKDVLQSVGEPGSIIEKHKLDSDAVEAGVFQAWSYYHNQQDMIVCFDRFGKVMFASDFSQKPPPKIY